MSATGWLVTGVPGAGKTTVAAALAKRYPLAAIVHADTFGDWLEAGNAVDPLSGLGIRSAISRRCAAFCAAEFARAGRPVVIDDTIEEAEQAAGYAAALPGLRRIHLRPTMDVALARSVARTTKPSGDAAHLETIARRLYGRMTAELTAARGWLVVDTSALAPEATVDLIVSQLGL